MRIVLVALLLVVSSLSFAEQKQVFGEYEVHYIGLTTSDLDKDVAKSYDITRSRMLGFLNISVLKTGLGPLPVAWNAKIEGQMSNLIGQTRNLEFIRIQETGALYFYSTFKFYDEDMYRFKLKITPEGSKQSIDMNFSQRFYRGL